MYCNSHWYDLSVPTVTSYHSPTYVSAVKNLSIAMNTLTLRRTGLMVNNKRKPRSPSNMTPRNESSTEPRFFICIEGRDLAAGSQHKKVSLLSAAVRINKHNLKTVDRNPFISQQNKP